MILIIIMQWIAILIMFVKIITMSDDIDQIKKDGLK